VLGALAAGAAFRDEARALGLSPLKDFVSFGFREPCVRVKQSVERQWHTAVPDLIRDLREAPFPAQNRILGPSRKIEMMPAFFDVALD
jgi:hypothetical protein